MSPEEKDQPVLTLEASLIEDTDGSFLRELTESLNSELLGVKQEMNSGLPPEEYQASSAYASGLEAAAEVVSSVWNREHR